MTLSDIANFAQIIGGVAVVVSLFYVASQIRQNTGAVRSATAQDIHENFASWFRLVAEDSQLAQIAINGLRDYSSLTEVERARFIAAHMAFLWYSQNAYFKLRQGLLSAELWSGWELVIMNLVGSPGGRTFWNERGYLFGHEFRDYIENDLLRRTPHPNAKPLGAFSLGKPA